MQLSEAVLWLHVAAAVGWIGAAGAYVLASSALAGQAGEARDFARRAGPRLNRFCLVCAVIVPITGIGNLAFAARSRGGPLPGEFLGIVGAKVVLYSLMVWMLTRGTSRVAALASPGGLPDQELTGHELAENDLPDQSAGTRSMMHALTRSYLVMIAAGGIALLLGLWLAGV